MKKVFVFAMLLLVSCVLSANTRKQIQFVDENGDIRTDVTSVTIWDVGTTTASTLTINEAATASITNPMTSSSTNTGLDAGNGTIIFCSAANSFDLQIVVGGVTVKFYAITTITKKITIPNTVSTGLVLGAVPTYYIWVSPSGDDSTSGNGSFTTPYKTITKALATATATRNTIMVMPGTYSEVDLVWPNVNGLTLEAPFGGVSVEQSTKAGTAVLTIAPTSTATWSASIANIEFVSDYTAGTCIAIANANISANKKLIVELKNTTLSTKNPTDKSLTVANTVATVAVRVYASGDMETWEGLVSFAALNASDRLRIYHHRVIGAITMSGAVASEIALIGSCVPVPTMNAANRFTNSGCWHEDDGDPDTYSAYTDAYNVTR
jgi:hypothetical protein